MRRRLREHLDLAKAPPPAPGTFVGASELPWPDGGRPAPAVHWGDVGPVGLALAAGAPSDLLATHELYHAGVLWGVLGRDPAAVFWAERMRSERDEPPLLVELGCRLFRGQLVAPPFDRTLYACPRPLWPGLARHLDRLAFVARHGAADLAWRSTHWRGPVLDPVLARRLAAGRPAPPEPPTVPVHLFGLASDESEYAWEPARDHWRDPVCLSFRQNRPPGRTRRG